MTGESLPGPQPAREPRDLVFISYSRPDRDWLDHLLIFLKPYTRQNLKIWADPYIQVGDESTQLRRSPDRAGNVPLGAGRAVPNAKLSDREGSTPAAAGRDQVSDFDH
jgi:hypothetical protein